MYKRSVRKTWMLSVPLDLMSQGQQLLHMPAMSHCQSEAMLEATVGARAEC